MIKVLGQDLTTGLGGYVVKHDLHQQIIKARSTVIRNIVQNIMCMIFCKIGNIKVNKLILLRLVSK